MRDIYYTLYHCTSLCIRQAAPGTVTTKKMPISDQEFMTDPKSPLKKSYL